VGLPVTRTAARHSWLNQAILLFITRCKNICYENAWEIRNIQKWRSHIFHASIVIIY